VNGNTGLMNRELNPDFCSEAVRFLCEVGEPAPGETAEEAIFLEKCV